MKTNQLMMNTNISNVFIMLILGLVCQSNSLLAQDCEITEKAIQYKELRISKISGKYENFDFSFEYVREKYQDLVPENILDSLIVKIEGADYRTSDLGDCDIFDKYKFISRSEIDDLFYRNQMIIAESYETDKDRIESFYSITPVIRVEDFACVQVSFNTAPMVGEAKLFLFHFEEGIWKIIKVLYVAG